MVSGFKTCLKVGFEVRNALVSGFKACPQNWLWGDSPLVSGFKACPKAGFGVIPHWFMALKLVEGIEGINLGFIPSIPSAQ